MRFILSVAAAVSVFGWIAAQPVVAKETSKEAVPSKDKAPAKVAPATSKEALIRDAEAVRYVQLRLEEQTGLKGWKIELKDVVGSSKEFVASRADRKETGAVNVLKSYPNGGALRVYVVPRD